MTPDTSLAFIGSARHSFSYPPEQLMPNFRKIARAPIFLCSLCNKLLITFLKRGTADIHKGRGVIPPDNEEAGKPGR